MNEKALLKNKLALMVQLLDDMEEAKFSISCEIKAIKDKILNMPDDPIEKWQPKGGDWIVNLDGSVENACSDEVYANFGTEYSTKEAAKKARDAMWTHNRALTWLAENDDGFEENWRSVPNKNFYVTYNPLKKEWTYGYDDTYKNLGTVYMSSANAKKLCEMLNDGKVELLKGTIK